ncbi:hypothetical protein SAMN04487989_103195 [Bizionia echini]|uniref:Uncharacterized protein n=1 Tax=Bizionia echini TaxID=649333 RepID=A0A1I5BKH0_9FLAO|nr:hypothetical protein [Bizionia echini]SFN75258.1 hypothetical protein SAMN04487989_103195 [Bizionia echini]
MKPIVFALSVLSVLFLTCKNESRATNSASEDQKTSISDTLQLTLNNDEKWLVNAETHEGVKNMNAHIKQFNSRRSENYQELGLKLSKQTSYIIKNCTMTGNPHDQLHVVLVPMLDEISVLRESNNLISCKKAVTNLEDLIQAYFKHFNL